MDKTMDKTIDSKTQKQNGEHNVSSCLHHHAKNCSDQALVKHPTN